MNWWKDTPLYPGSRRVKDDPNYVRKHADRQARRDIGMAGSYNHIINKKNGDLLDNEEFVGMIENLGDAYEMTEELYGMIWFLAHMGNNAPAMTPGQLVEHARRNYQEGLALAKANKEKVVPRDDGTE